MGLDSVGPDQHVPTPAWAQPDQRGSRAPSTLDPDARAGLVATLPRRHQLLQHLLVEGRDQQLSPLFVVIHFCLVITCFQLCPRHPPTLDPDVATAVGTQTDPDVAMAVIPRLATAVVPTAFSTLLHCVRWWGPFRVLIH